MPLRRSNRVSYEATDVGSWSFVCSNVPVRNESMTHMLYEMNHTLNCGYEIKKSYDPQMTSSQRQWRARSRVQTPLKS